MRKNALTLCCFTCAAGAVGAFCRWLQNQLAFDSDGLSTKSFLNWVVALVIIAAAAGFYFFVRRIKKSGLVPAEDFGSAFRGSTRLYLPAAWVIGALMMVGALFLFANGANESSHTLLRILAVLSVFSGIFFPLAAQSTVKSADSGLVCLYLTLPVVQFCFWLITCYKQNSTNPAVWAYAVAILAIAAALLGFYYLAGYPYGRAKPYSFLYFSMLGSFMCIMSLADNRNFGEKLMFAAAAAMLMFAAWMVVSNMRPPQSAPSQPLHTDMPQVSEKDLGSIIEEVKNEDDK